MKATTFLGALALLYSMITGLQAQTPQMKSVVFANQSLKLAGHLYLPRGFDPARQYPAVITVHPGGGVKEQTAGLYAQKLAGEGYVALAFDASHQGESEGLPRLLEDPAQRVEDIKSAVDYLVSIPYVNPARIGLLGICAGGGYAASAAQTDHRIKALAVASPVDIGLTTRKGWDGKASLGDQLNSLEAVSKQRSAEAQGAPPVYVNYVPEKPDATTPPDLVEAHAYYRTPRAQHPNSPNRFLLTSVDKIIAFDAFANLGTLLNQRLLIVAGSDAGSRWQGELMYTLAPKASSELVLINGATHMDLYDVPQYVDQVLVRLSSFFGKYL